MNSKKSVGYLRHHRRVVVLIALCAAAGSGLTGLALASGEGSGELEGEALGRSLGLEPARYEQGSCGYFAEYEDGWGFCLDEVADSLEERFVLASRLRGEPATDEDLERFRLSHELSNLSDSEDPEDVARANQIMDRIRSLGD